MSGKTNPSNEAEYLAQYNIHDFAVPLTSVDSVLFSVRESKLVVLLVKRANYPCLGKWAIPGGFVDFEQDADLDASANRHLARKTGIKPPYLEQLQSVGNNTRDPRGWSVTVSYFALMTYMIPRATDAVEQSAWFDINDLPGEMAFDHQQLISLALQRLRQKSLYSLIAAFALPPTFTLSELQLVHEIILGKTLQKKSFRRRIEQADVLAETGDSRAEVGRPAKLYKVLPKAANYRFIRNLEA